jgi:hypothetical protein
VAAHRDDARSWRGRRYLTVVGRLAPSVTRTAAQAEMDALSARLAERYPTANAGHGVLVSPLEEDAGRFRRLRRAPRGDWPPPRDRLRQRGAAQLPAGEDRRRSWRSGPARGEPVALIRQLGPRACCWRSERPRRRACEARRRLIAAALPPAPRLETRPRPSRVGFALAPGATACCSVVPALRAVRGGGCHPARGGRQRRAGRGGRAVHW